MLALHSAPYTSYVSGEPFAAPLRANGATRRFAPCRLRLAAAAGSPAAPRDAQRLAPPSCRLARRAPGS
jgi:hypothetical protein